MKVTTYVLPGSKSHSCSARQLAGVGTVRVASKPGGLNVRNDIDCEIRSAVKPFGGYKWLPTQFGSWWGRPTLWGKKRKSAPHGTAAVQVQASRERLVEITSGRAISQQGLAATCEDPGTEARAEETGRDLV